MRSGWPTTPTAWWNPPWLVAWQRMWWACRYHLTRLPDGLVWWAAAPNGEHAAAWLCEQSARRPMLQPRQQSLVDELLSLAGKCRYGSRGSVRPAGGSCPECYPRRRTPAAVPAASGRSWRPSSTSPAPRRRGRIFLRLSGPFWPAVAAFSAGTTTAPSSASVVLSCLNRTPSGSSSWPPTSACPHEEIRYGVRQGRGVRPDGRCSSIRCRRSIWRALRL